MDMQRPKALGKVALLSGRKVLILKKRTLCCNSAARISAIVSSGKGPSKAMLRTSAPIVGFRAATSIRFAVDTNIVFPPNFILA
jgi:hypothetical protein